MDLFFDMRDRAAQGKSQKCHAHDPAESSQDAESEEFPVTHVADTGDGRGEGPDDRDKAGQDERFGAVFIVKVLRAFQMVLVEEKGIFSAKKPRSEVIAEPVAGVIAGDSGYGEQGNEDLDTKRALDRGKESGGHKQGISGEEKSGEQARLGINDDRQDKIAAPAYQFFKVVELREEFV